MLKAIIYRFVCMTNSSEDSRLVQAYAVLPSSILKYSDKSCKQRIVNADVHERLNKSRCFRRIVEIVRVSNIARA